MAMASGEVAKVDIGELPLRVGAATLGLPDVLGLTSIAPDGTELIIAVNFGLVDDNIQPDQRGTYVLETILAAGAEVVAHTRSGTKVRVSRFEPVEDTGVEDCGEEPGDPSGDREPRRPLPTLGSAAVELVAINS